MIFFKPRQIVLDCFTVERHAYEFAPPVRATKYLPDWWKALPTPEVSYKFDAPYNNSNMRHCTGVTDLYKKAITLPLWCDVDLWVGPTGTTDFGFQFADAYTLADIHAESQYAGFFKPDRVQHLKFISPWHFVTKENIYWSAIPAIYNQRLEEYQLLQGMVNFRNQHRTHLQIVFPRAQEKRLIHIKHRTPMYMYVPMSERPVSIRTHLISQHELMKLVPRFVTRNKCGATVAALRSENDKCPFFNGSNQQ